MEATHLKQVEQELHIRLRQQEVLAELGKHALTINSMDDLFDRVVETVAATLQVEYCKVLELLPGDQELLLRSGVGWKEGYVGRATVSTDKGSQAGYTLLTDEPVLVSDLREETRFSAPSLLLEHDVVSGMSVIIPGKNRPFGVLGAHSTNARNFTLHDANFLKTVAGFLAASIARLSVARTLRTSRDQLQIILQGVADGITVQDKTGRLVYANEAAARLIGFPSAEALINAPIDEVIQKYDLFGEDGKPLSWDRLPGRLALQDHEEVSATLRFRVRETGEDRWSLVKATPVFDQFGQVELAVNIFQDITELKRNEIAQHLLAEASDLISASLDYATTLRSVAETVVPKLADWCVVHVVEENQAVQQLAVAHTDPDKVSMALELQEKYPPDPEASVGARKVVLTGEAQFMPRISDEMIQDFAQDEEHFRLMRQLGLKSAMILPLVAREQVLGAITLVWAESGRRYDQSDVDLAQELARRAAVAIDNARLYNQAQQLNQELESRVAKRTNQLQRIINSLRNEIAERKRAEEALRQSETMLKSLFDSAPDATILVDKDGKIVQVNNQTETMFNYSREELLGKSVDVLVPARFQSVHAKHRGRFLSERRIRPMGAELDLYGRRKDGSEFPVDVMLSPLDTDQGKMVISAVRDITESKQLQAELAESQRRFLNSLESERVTLAQDLHDGPIQDLYGVIYRLNSLDPKSDAAQETVDQETVAFTAAAVQKVIQALRAICGDLRPPSLAPFGLEKAIREHVSQFKKAHPEIEVELHLMSDGKRLPEGTRLALFRVYQNAVSNVVRHAQAQNLKVRFEIDAELVVLEISDDGRGFELPSRWIEFARRGHFGLVGMVERIKAIGGRINIASSPNKGTSIRVIIPRE